GGNEASGSPRATWAFFVGPRREGRDVGDGAAALPGERSGRAARRARGARVGGRDAGEARRPEVLRPARDLAAPDPAAVRLRRVRVRGRRRLRRLVDPRLAG